MCLFACVCVCVCVCLRVCVCVVAYPVIITPRSLSKPNAHNSTQNPNFFVVNPHSTKHTNMFDIQRTVHRDIFPQQKPTRCTNSQIYFDKELYMFRTDFLSIIRSLNTILTAVGICDTSYVRCLLTRSGLILMDSKYVRNV